MSSEEDFPPSLRAQELLFSIVSSFQSISIIYAQTSCKQNRKMAVEGSNMPYLRVPEQQFLEGMPRIQGPDCSLPKLFPGLCLQQAALRDEVTSLSAKKGLASILNFGTYMLQRFRFFYSSEAYCIVFAVVLVGT